MGGYYPSIVRGNCLILSLTSEAGTSTAEIIVHRDGPDGKLGKLGCNQHHAAFNGTPAKEHVDALDAWLSRVQESMDAESDGRRQDVEEFLKPIVAALQPNGEDQPSGGRRFLCFEREMLSDLATEEQQAA